MIIFIYKCIFVILMVKTIHCQNNCRNIIRVYKTKNNNLFATITVPMSDDETHNIRLNVEMQIANPYYTVNRQQSLKKNLQYLGTPDDIIYNRPLVFKLDYPPSNIQPRITSISMNNQLLCSEERLTGYIQDLSTLNFNFVVTINNNNYYRNQNARTTKQPDIFHSNTNPPPVINTINQNVPNIPSKNQYFYQNQPTNVPIIPTKNKNLDQNQQTNVPNIPKKNRNIYQNRQTTQRSAPVRPKNSNRENLFDNCGKLKSNSLQLIANGKDAAMGAYPWIGALFLREKSQPAKFLCGASLIAKKVALTAAHCVSNYLNTELYLVFGRNGINDWLDENDQKVKVQHAVIHPDYKEETSDADIAILQFTTEISYSPTVKPICLWSMDSLSENIVNQTGVIVGWGKDENFNYAKNLQELDLRVVDEEECLRSSDGFFNITSSRTFCAGSDSDYSGPCNGDSGGGFYFFVNQRWTIRGIVSRSLLNLSGRCDVSKYAIYCDVAKHIQWIHQYL